MFPRGPRFEPLKVPDVPGPNAYNPQDPQPQPYKRSAFLEKTDRFSSQKEPSAPPPDIKKPPSPSLNLADRYAVLQKKVQDLESVHDEQKKTHRAELERVKQDLARSQKLIHEHADRIDKCKKQNDSLEGRIRDLRKAVLVDQAEIKDLRLKLRLSDHEKAQLSTKNAELIDSNKSLQASELKRKQDIRDKDKKIADLEKSVAAESKRRLLAESALNDFKSILDHQLHDAREAANTMQSSAQTAQLEVEKAKAELDSIHRNTAEREHSLLQQVEQCHILLGTAAREYARLSAMTVPRNFHDQLKRQHSDAQFRIIKLERKLVNAEGQVVELAHLIRQTNEQNAFLKTQMQDALYEIAVLSAFHSDVPYPFEGPARDSLDDIKDKFHALHTSHLQAGFSIALSFQNLYQVHSEDIIWALTILQEELGKTQAVSEQCSQDLISALASHEAIAARLEVAQRNYSELQEQYHVATADLTKRQSAIAVLETQMADMQHQVHNDKIFHETMLKKEKDTQQRLSSALQKSRIVQDALRIEVEQLTAELANAEQYQQAYLALSGEVQLLISRNELAEDEAYMLSKVNAEILGHHNPSQKIMYVDRIRQELAEAKQRIVALTREQESIYAQNADLQHELEMYKSVIVPATNKPRTNITRIGRPPLVSLGRSMNINHWESSKLPISTTPTQCLNVISDDMTIDEFI